MTSDERHKHLVSIMKRLPSDFEPYGEREREGWDCSCGCKHYMELFHLEAPGGRDSDWGVCVNPKSPRCGLLTFEHQGCPEFEGD